MSNRKRERRRAREGALALLYSSDITEVSVGSIVEDGAYPDDGIVVSKYAERLVQGVTEHLGEIDAKLDSTSENWPIERMPLVDRAILRVAVFEMLFVEEVPISVAINEAVELAKKYGGEDESSRFVNGVLGKIARSLEEPPAEDVEGAESADEAAGSDGAASTDDVARPGEAENSNATENPDVSGDVSCGGHAAEA